MAILSDADLTAGTIIAVALIVIALFAWPGFARVSPRGLAGYWALERTGALFEVRPAAGRAFVVSNGKGFAPGAVRGVRGVRLALPGEAATRAGRVELGGRQIVWGGSGDVWLRQGLR